MKKRNHSKFLSSLAMAAVFFCSSWCLMSNADAEDSAAGAQAPQVKIPQKDKFYLFLLAGQSNMAGRGTVENEDKVVNPRVLALSKEGKWVPAVDPIHFDKPSAGVGPGRSFALALTEKLGPEISIGLIPCAVGGSPISVWQPGVAYAGGKPYDNAIARTNLAMQDGVLKGILWHQGESDISLEDIEKYQARLTELIARFRKDLKSPDAPVIIGQLGDFFINANAPESQNLDAAMKNVAKEDGAAAFVSADGLVSNPDKLHFNAKSQRELGRRYAEAYLKLPPRAATSVKVQAVDDNKNSPNNLLKDLAMTDGLLVNGKPAPGYEKTYKHSPAIAVVAGTAYVISQGIDYQGGEYDDQMKILRNIRMKHDGKNVVLTTSPNTAFVRINLNNNDNERYFMKESDFKGSVSGASSKPAVPVANDSAPEKGKANPVRNGSNTFTGGAQWQGKKIAWYGTSIPAGYPKQSDQSAWSYANRSAAAVGATIQNYSVPNGVVRESKCDGSALGGGRDALSFTKTTSAVNYEKSMLALIGTANEPDLFVFDYGVNDADADVSEFSKFDPLDPYNDKKLSDKISIASRDKKTYIGAQNWVIDQLLKAKPNARIAFVTHYSKDDARNAPRKWEKLIQVQNALGEYWGFPICTVYSKTGWINRDGNNTIKIFNPDGIHPATATTTQSVDILTVILTDFLKGIY